MIARQPEKKVTKRPSMAENLSTASEARYTALEVNYCAQKWQIYR
jgi:hypothetical protein